MLMVELGAVILSTARSQAPSGSWQSQAPKVLCECRACLPITSSCSLPIVLLRTRQANSLYHLEIQNEFCFFVFSIACCIQLLLLVCA